MMDDMDELVAWIREQLDERERVAQAAMGRRLIGGTWSVVDPDRYPGMVGDAHGDPVTFGHSLGGATLREHADHIVLNDPDTVLREVEAKRRILDAYEKALDRRRLFRDDVASAGALLQMVAVVKLLALPYSGRPGYRREWAP